MWERLRRRVTFANALAVLALFVALGGTGYAAVQVTGDDVRDGSLTGAAPRPRSGPWATAARWPGPRPPVQRPATRSTRCSLTRGVGRAGAPAPGARATASSRVATPSLR